MQTEETIQSVATQLELTVRSNDLESNKCLIADRINHLIQNDFQKLVFILYRLDVSENKLKELLQKNPGTDASLIIMDLMIERELQKIRSRQQFSGNDSEIDENEKW